jgi:glutathione S-transferase
MNQIIGVIDWCLMPRVTATIGFNRVVAPAFGLPVDEMKIAEAMPGARHCLAELARLQDGQPWMADEALSLADLHLAGHLLMLSEAPEGEALLAGQPGLAAWLDRLSARAGMCRTTWAALAEA